MTTNCEKTVRRPLETGFAHKHALSEPRVLHALLGIIAREALKHQIAGFLCSRHLQKALNPKTAACSGGFLSILNTVGLLAKAPIHPDTGRDPLPKVSPWENQARGPARGTLPLSHAEGACCIMELALLCSWLARSL